MRASVLVLTVVACWSTTPAPPTLPAPADRPPSAAIRPSRSAPTHEQRCTRSLSAAFDVSRGEFASSGLAPDVVDELQDAFVTSCEITQWADDVVDCVGAISTVADWSPCQNMMTQEQKDDSIKRAVEILQKRNAMPTAPAPSPPPP